MGLNTIVLPLIVASFALIDAVSTGTESNKSPMKPLKTESLMNEAEIAVVANNRLRHTLDAFDEEDSADGQNEERGLLKSLSLEKVKVYVPRTQAHKVAADAKKAAATAKKLEDIRLTMLRTKRDDVLNSQFAKWFLDSKTADNVIDDFKAMGKSDIEADNLGKVYGEWLTSLLNPKIS